MLEGVEMIKLAVIGLGNMGKLHLKNIIKLEEYKLCQLACVCDINRNLTDEFSDKLKVKGYYNVLDMMKDDKFDAAIIAITSVNHFEIAKLLLENNKPVLVEKPVVISLKEAEELKRICDKKKVLLSPGYTEVYNSVTTGIKNYLKNDNKIEYVDFFRIGQKNERNDIKDIDVIQDLMTHDLAVLSQITDITKIKNISGVLNAFNEKSSKYDISSVNLIFENNSMARFLCDRIGTMKIRRFTISKEDMHGEFDFMDQAAEIMKKGSIDAFGDNIWYSQNFDAVKIKYSNNPLLDEIKDFILAVKENRQTLVSPKWFEITKLIEIIRSKLYDEN